MKSKAFQDTLRNVPVFVSVFVTTKDLVFRDEILPKGTEGYIRNFDRETFVVGAKYYRATASNLKFVEYRQL